MPSCLSAWCAACRPEQALDDSLRRALPPNLRQEEAVKIWQAEGCEKCNSTGYAGHMGIHDVFNITPHIQDLLIQHKNLKEIERAAIAKGVRDISTDGILKAINRFTTLF